MDEVQELQNMVDRAGNIVFFGGAGVSTESGIPDFRSTDGLYNTEYDYPPEDILSLSFFEENPREFFRFYKSRIIAPAYDAEPNAAHRKLAELEDAGKLSAVITQNIDGLHQKAGSRNVIELHGSIHQNYCIECGNAVDLHEMKSRLGMYDVPRCTECGGIIRPDIVLYGETPDPRIMWNAVTAICGADVLIVAGTSLSVYPAASLIDYFRGNGLVVINQDPTPRDAEADLLIRKPVGEILGKIIVREKKSHGWKNRIESGSD